MTRRRKSWTDGRGINGKGAHVPGGAQDDRDLAIRRELEDLAWLLDRSIPLPGGWRIGLDGIIGLIPGVGDALGAAISSYIVARASALGLPKSVITRMLVNVALDTTIGAIPVAGDLFDFAYKANQRNIMLLRGYIADPDRTRRSSRVVILAVTLALVVLAVVLAWLVISLVAWLAARA